MRKKLTAIAALFIVVSLALAGCGLFGTPSASEPPSSEPGASQNPTESPGASQEPEAPKYLKAAGEYKVGKDIAAGKYLLVVDKNAIISMGYYQVTAKLGAEAGDPEFLYNETFSQRHYVEVADGQYLKFSSCKLYELASAPAIEKTDAYWAAGHYLTGTDIDAGDYLLITDKPDTETAFFGTFRVEAKPDAEIGSDEFLYIDNFSNRNYIRLQEGQYVEFSGCKLYRIDRAPAVDKNAAQFRPGQYLVGRDIDAGTYRLTAIQGIVTLGTYTITLTPHAAIGTADFIKIDNFQNEALVELADGQYISIAGAAMQKNA